MTSVLAVDIGGSGFRVARVEKGAVSDRHSYTVPPQIEQRQLVELWRAAIAELRPDEGDGAIGVSFPGFFDAKGLVAPSIYVLSMSGMDLRQAFGSILPGRLVVPLPDLAAAALAEAGVPGRSRRLLCVGLGTGTNAALAVDERVLDLAGGCLGDAGHVVVEEDGPPCRCGGRGCLEAVCSGDALSRDGKADGFDGPREIVEAAAGGDLTAEAILRRAGRALGRAMACWAAMTFPDEIVTVGGLSSAGEWLLAPARSEMRRVGQPALVAHLRVSVGSYGADAPLYGAAVAAAKELAREPAFSYQGGRS